MKRLLSITLSLTFFIAGLSLSVFAAETVTIGLDENKAYKADELAMVKILASGVFEKIELVINYELQSTLYASGNVDLSALSIGRHRITATSYNGDAVVATSTVKILLVNEYGFENWSNDLTSYTSTGAAFPSGMKGSFGSSRGTATIKSVTNAETYGEEHGIVAEIKATGSSGTTPAENGAYWHAVNTEGQSAFKFEFDMYIASVPAAYDFQLRYVTTSTQLKRIARITNSNIAGVADTTSANYERNKWYHFAFDIDLAAGTSSLTVMPAGETTPILNAAELIGAQVDSATMRMTLSVTSEGQIADAAQDNFKLTVKRVSPVVSAIGYGDNTDSEIPPEEKEVLLTMNTPLNPATVTTDTVKVYLNDESNREILVENASYNNNKIAIQLEEALIPSALYRVELGTGVQDANNNPLSAKVKDWFVTSAAKLDVTDLKTMTDANGFCVTGTMVDTKNSGDSLITVLAVWEGDRLMDIKYKQITAGTFTTDYVAKSEEQTIQFIIMDKFYCPNVLIKKLN